MNKTIKVIDLLNIIAIGIEEIPLTIKYGNNIYWWDNKNKQYHNGTECYFNLSFHTNELNNTVEIIEEEPEIDIQSMQEVTSFGIKQNQNAINELIKAVKQLDRQINNK